jgi:hypothetical protein
LLKNDVKKRKERLSLELERKLTVWKLDTDEEWLLGGHPYTTLAFLDPTHPPYLHKYNTERQQKQNLREN